MKDSTTVQKAICVFLGRHNKNLPNDIQEINKFYDTIWKMFSNEGILPCVIRDIPTEEIEREFKECSKLGIDFINKQASG